MQNNQSGLQHHEVDSMFSWLMAELIYYWMLILGFSVVSYVLGWTITSNPGLEAG